MKIRWDIEVIYRLADMVKSDADYQELLEKCRSLETDYLRITDGLPEGDRELLDTYIAACEDMQYRMTQLAYLLGQLDILRNRTI